MTEGLRDIYLWKYYGKTRKMFPGYNFSARKTSCEALLQVFTAFVESDGENLQLPTSPVPNQMVRTVSGGKLEYTSLSSLLITRASTTALLESQGALELKLTVHDLRKLLDATEAIRDGIGDFSIYKGQFWLWPCIK